MKGLLLTDFQSCVGALERFFWRQFRWRKQISKIWGSGELWGRFFSEILDFKVVSSHFVCYKSVSRVTSCGGRKWSCNDFFNLFPQESSNKAYLCFPCCIAGFVNSEKQKDWNSENLNLILLSKSELWPFTNSSNRRKIVRVSMQYQSNTNMIITKPPHKNFLNLLINLVIWIWHHHSFIHIYLIKNEQPSHSRNIFSFSSHFRRFV